MIRVKICGITDADGLRAAAAAAADWVGFVFWPGSPRAVDSAAAARIAAAVPGGPDRVGLFVSPSMGEIEAVLGTVRLHALQIYGPGVRAGAVRTRFGLPVWEPIGVAERRDLPDASTGADRFVIEPRAPDGTAPGGRGAALDWSLPRGWAAPKPWLLAGGLTPANVAEAIRASGARAVDVSSGVECAPGRKDPDLIAAFVRAARGVITDGTAS